MPCPNGKHPAAGLFSPPAQTKNLRRAALFVLLAALPGIAALAARKPSLASLRLPESRQKHVLPIQSPDARCALDFAGTLCREFSPRDAGTDGALAAARWIAQTAVSLGLNVSCDYFHDKTPRGTKTFCNVWASFPDADENNPSVVLVSHFDTKSGIRGFQGANDGASTTGLLLAAAKCLRQSDVRKRLNILFLFTDGEECMERRYSPSDGFHGARAAARKLAMSRANCIAVIGLDMLGGENLRIKIPFNGTERLKNIALAAARDVNDPGLLSLGDESFMVKDDFNIFLEAGFPAIDLIDFDYPHWHTSADTIDKLSVRSLRRAGELLTAILNRIRN